MEKFSFHPSLGLLFDRFQGIFRFVLMRRAPRMPSFVAWIVQFELRWMDIERVEDFEMMIMIMNAQIVDAWIVSDSKQGPSANVNETELNGWGTDNGIPE